MVPKTSEPEVEIIVSISMDLRPALEVVRPSPQLTIQEETITLLKMMKSDASTIMGGQLAQELISLIILPIDQELQRGLTTEAALGASSISIIVVRSSFPCSFLFSSYSLPVSF